VTNRQYLTVTDIMRIWSEERGQPVSRRTVYAHLDDSRPDVPGQPRRKRPRRYQGNPMPMPAGDVGQRQPLLWEPAPGETVADLERRLRAWWHSRVGRGAGGGRQTRRGRR
jgi:hypothetical protein